MRIYFSGLSRLFFYAVLVIGLLLCNPLAIADDIEKRGDAYLIYLPENLNYLEIVDRLKSEILAQNWEITDVQDIDVGLKQYGKSTQNKVISVCRSQLLAQAITEDPFVSLIIPCRFTAFRETVKEAGGKASGKIVLGFVDPAAEAKAIKIKQYKAAQQATDELKSVLQTMADFYKE